MKEQIHTIPLNDAFSSDDECPFCWLERQVEQSAINYTVGPEASYMESDVRGETDELGFCRSHIKMLYDFGNSLGSALILQTHYKIAQQELAKHIASFDRPAKRGLFSRGASGEDAPPLVAWTREKQDRCYVCARIDYNMTRYFETFFAMLKDAEFRAKVENCKGFCLRHFGELLDSARKNLSGRDHEWFYETVFPLMTENLQRVKDDLDYFIGLFDYRQVGADPKNSATALSRTMQKLRGLHPSDPPFKGKK